MDATKMRPNTYCDWCNCTEEVRVYGVKTENSRSYIKTNLCPNCLKEAQEYDRWKIMYF